MPSFARTSSLATACAQGSQNMSPQFAGREPRSERARWRTAQREATITLER